MSFERFLRERAYLHNVSPRTIEWHKQSLRWLAIEQPTEDDLKACVIRMREAGLTASSCNSRARSINAYLRWSSLTTGSALSIPKMKENTRVLPTYSVEDVRRFAAWKPGTKCGLRLQALILLLADTGLRIGEALALRWSDIDFDNLLLTVTCGKGGHGRVIPFSAEWRRYAVRLKGDGLVFAARSGRALTRSCVLRDTKLLCTRLSIRCPERSLHAFRHSFATNYIRSGGSVVMLQRLLGHSSITMTMVYVNIQTADLSAAHQRHSLLKG
jgi:integrase/recombinase XerD